MAKLIRLASTDQRLVKQCLRGDSKAQREMYDRYSSLTLSVCRRYVKSIEDAEEVLSNTFIKVFTKINQYSGEGELGAWIRRIAVNESLSFIRYKKNLFVEMDEENHIEVSQTNLLDEMDANHLMAMIGDLPVGYRTVFNLYAIEGYTHKEIGEMLNISDNTSKSQLSKARKHLQERLEANKLLYKEQ